MFDAISIRDRVLQVAVTEAGLLSAVAQDAAFHLTDWLDDLQAFVEFCRKPNAATSDQVNAMLIAFLLHAPNHIAAAAKLYADSPVSDIFAVGAVR